MAKTNKTQKLPGVAEPIPLGIEEIDSCFSGGGALRGQLMMLAGGSGSGKTMLATQIVASMAAENHSCLFFTLEQYQEVLYDHLEAQTIAREPKNGEAAVKQLYEHVVVFDNVSSKPAKPEKMTPARIESIIQKVNGSQISDSPVEVVVIDCLSLVELEESVSAPRGAMSALASARGQVMEELFRICKQENVLMIVLEGLHKKMSTGAPTLPGSIRQAQLCDFILQIRRPRSPNKLADLGIRGQHEIVLSKNRRGSCTTARRYFNERTLTFQLNEPAITPSLLSNELIADSLSKVTF